MGDKFKDTFSKLDTQTIINQIEETWNKPYGCVFREYGFEIIEERLGEEEADRIYNYLWKKQDMVRS